MEKNFSRFILLLLLIVLFGSSTFAMQYLPLMEREKTENNSEFCESENTVAAAEITDYEMLQTERKILRQFKTTKEEKSPVSMAMRAEQKHEIGDKQTVQKNAAKPEQEQPKTITRPKKQTEEKNKADSAEKTKAAAAAEQAKPEKKDTPSSPYSLGASREFTFLSQAVVKNKGEEVATNISIHIPLVTTSSPYFSLRGETFSIQPKEIQTVNGTRVGIFSLPDLQPGEEVTLDINTKVRCFKISFFANYQPEGGKQITSYLGSGNGIESTNGQIINLAKQLTEGLACDWEKAQAITKWVATNIKYNANAAQRNNGALNALTSRSGVCEDFAKLSAALARAAKIPARVVYGYADSGSKWPASGSFSLRTYRHAWVEFYLSGRGWVPADPTLSNAAKLYFGTLPHNRYLIQNYNNQALKGKYSGGQLAITWSDTLK